MSGITTHVLDTAKGQPAVGVLIRLSLKVENEWKELGQSTTNADGRAPDLLAKDALIVAGLYKLVFETGEYFARSGIKGFYPTVPIIFEITNPQSHHHVPLLLSPYGYSTYRGS